MAWEKFGVKYFDNSKVMEDLKDFISKDESKYKELTTIKYGSYGEFQKDLTSYMEHLDFFNYYQVYDEYKEKECTSVDEYLEFMRSKFEVKEYPFVNNGYIEIEGQDAEFKKKWVGKELPWMQPIFNILDMKVYGCKEENTWIVTVQVKGYDNKMLVTFDDEFCDYEDALDYIYDPQGDCTTFYVEQDLGDGYKVDFSLAEDFNERGVTVRKYEGTQHMYSVTSTSGTIEGAMEDMKKFELSEGVK